MSLANHLSSSPPSAILSAISPNERLRRLPNLDLSSLDLNNADPSFISPISGSNRSSVHSLSNSGELKPAEPIDIKNGALAVHTSGARPSLDETEQVGLRNTSARYVTVSSILSRSGNAIPLSALENTRKDRVSSREAQSYASGSKRQHDMPQGSMFRSLPNFSRRQTFAGEASNRSKAVSNGSALEVLGALLLQRDSSGKVSNLSFTRYNRDMQESDSAGRKISHGLSRVSRAFLQGIKEAGAARLGIRMPEKSDKGQTIAQRRARKQGFNFQNLIMGTGLGDAVSNLQDGEMFLRVGTKSWHPTFEVSVPKKKDARNGTFLLGHAAKSQIVADIPSELTLSPLAFNQPNQTNSLLERRKIKDNLVSGMGSAFTLNDPLEAPPSPIGMPGAWTVGGSAWSTKSGDWREEGALLLPPPLLDDFGSDAKSFEGLLGVKRMREQERARKELEKLKARNRPAHKVGILTAFSNFIKAAHAADKASKAAQHSSRPVESLTRRHTEPTNNTRMIKGPEYFGDEDKEPEEVEKEDSEIDSDGEGHYKEEKSQPMMRISSQGRKSIDSIGRSLDTVFEGIASADGSMATPSDITRRSSLALSRTSSRHEYQAPKAPRLLPIYFSVGSPTTPFALDQETSKKNRDPSAPTTPRLGPTLLSLPPSPWVYSSIDEHMSHNYSLNLSMASLHGPPGTPRLGPTALEITPSPFPLSPNISPLVKDHHLSTSRNLNAIDVSMEVTSPLALSPQRSPVISGLRKTQSNVRKRKIQGQADQSSRDELSRLTPSAMIGEAREEHEIPKQEEVNDKETTKADEKPSMQRSFFLWFLFGDLGIGTRSKIAAKASGSSLSSNSTNQSATSGILLDSAAHLYGFTIFLVAHLVDLTYRIAETLSMTFWFLRWLTLNLTGQTILARCIIDAYKLVEKEWQIVSREDHEDRGTKRSKDQKENEKKFTGLSRWQVIKGLIELFCLQDVTRARYHEEGAGLEEIKGWNTKRERRSDAATSSSSQQERLDLGIKRQNDRHALLSSSSQMSSGSEGEGSDESSESSDDEMVVTSQGPDILEFTKTPRVEHRGYFHSHLSSISSSKKFNDERFLKDARWTGEDKRSMVKTIKWASRLAISAYGLHVTLVDLPPTFTPSGNRFSRQTFAHLSRLHHEDVLHADIQTFDSDAYSPTFYLVRDLKRKVVIVSVRGTQSLQDIIVDLEMNVNEVKLSGDIQQSEEKLYCHAGVLRAAQALLSKESTLFKTLNKVLVENKEFGIVLTGHSLGGAIASTVVLLLARYISGANSKDGSDGGGVWVTHDTSGLPAGRSIRAITFAHPTTVNASLANRAALGKIPLVLSIVLGSDIIPRCGHGQARELRRVLGGLSRVRKRKGDLFHPQRKSIIKEDARIHIVMNWWRWKMIKRKESPSEDELAMTKRIEDELWSLRCDVENDLYAAIKQRSSISQMNEKDSDAVPKYSQTIPPSPWIGPDQRSKAPLHQLASRRQELDAITVQNEESISGNGILVPAGQSILIHDGKLYRITSPLSFFSLPDLHPRMFAEHFPSAYETALLEDIKL